MLRESCVAVVIVGLGAWATGLVGGNGGYSRVVDRPPAEVAQALADLDIRKAPGSPGTDPMASGGELPTFSVEQAADHVSYIVMAHGQVAMTMTAWLKPVDGGKRTKVTATVQRGPAPDDYVSPAFRSTGITMGLFAEELEGELDQLVFPTHEWDAQCDKIMADFEAANEANGMDRPGGTLTQAFGQTAKLSMHLGQLDKELKAAGCPSNRSNDFQPVSSQLSEDQGSPPPVVKEQSQVGKPSTDLSKYR